ncbi:EAL and HDOD domain-containing protein [Acidipila rosea]|uniref:Diguanylate phosphodiesterase n=1 Tax=Acidipila rosea TaxID=768535 RepID=A0A4R1LFB7_9BACT|nr:HDOD domain-containing protein [Acidipila rosea]TCK75369.1 diguanylate phosphodiesterase [Acidipila rosea]
MQVLAPTRFLAKQPIFDSDLQLFGYELLFREGFENCFSGSPESATKQVMDSYLLLCMDSDPGTIFLNCTRDALVSRLVTLLPPATTVLEILEDVEPDEAVLAACSELRRKGYRFALDDFSPLPSRMPLLQFADFIKVDFQLSSAADRAAIYALVHGTNIKLLAEKVETQEEVEEARREGNTYFQGYFFSRPQVIAQRDIPPNHTTYMRLLAALSQTPLDMKSIEQLVVAEASLCYRLLRLVNSALFGLRREVQSIHNALIMIGEQEFRKLVTVALAGVLAENQQPTLISLALERARFCELLAPPIEQNSAEQYLLGLLSLVDAILESPMQQVVDSLPLRPEVKAALLGEPNFVGMPLHLRRRYEEGNWQACSDLQQVLGLTESFITQVYVDAVSWANQVLCSAREVHSA